MKKINLLFTALIFALILTIGLACKSSSTSNSTSNTSAANKNGSSSSEAKKADITTTAEELFKEFSDKSLNEANSKKYGNKTIAVTGKVFLVTIEKPGTTDSFVQLYGSPDDELGMYCYFDDKHADQLKKLSEGKMVKVQGFKDDKFTPGLFPTLEHCTVLEVK